ncbi:phosphoglycolate phosphatase [Haloferula helveola]|uniref:Phosphoglycolate phosphatase n=1 Tax=Haloferula helveola TaxID=490095 RepID=A0ABM7RBY8_9BACT|nr:phosphoglycolate phosphatase [Haloferula helveola]
MAYRTIIFDFDGTLADTLEESRRIFNAIAPDYGIREVTAEELPSLRHMSIKELIGHLKIPKRRVPAFIAKGTAMMRGNIVRLQLIEGIGEILPVLRSRCQSFGVLTSNAPTNVDLFLRAHGLRGLFNFISSTSKLTGKAKHLKAIRKTFSLKSEEMLYVGDEIRDIKASQKASIPVAAVTWGFNSPETLAAEKPDHLLTSPNDFLEIVPQA